ncbi:ABC-type Zn2+ transport system, periplasmic component/surface adhesin [Hahella chejuensis KCTC 2396]|uniref:High-affinity zinc uptake system protein ZnuA n=1 Tax=Hahella chejuensis (strain KCTC 2396) TaxID=349521 RepID=Q2SJF1_HAHCH|nr:zinc ABC transporter substrate-binding protein [Hahella chejuensis]ABC29223.1 ABC-type Zn2+ transport system, periplasmic component/surface adhesin [Hahella chejuensis KCTC 2396]
MQSIIRTLSQLFKVLLLLNLSTLPAQAADKIKVLTSIKPLSLIVNEAFGDTVQVDYLLPPMASPHMYQLKPSDARRLQAADVFLWVGPELERFLPKILEKYSQLEKVDALSYLESSQDALLLAFNQSRQDDSHDHSHDGAHDPHVWLSANVAGAIALNLAETLSRIDPIGADYQALARKYQTQMRQLTDTSQMAAQQLSHKNLLTYHNGFNYFANELSLNIVDVVALQPETSPGARHLSEIKSKAISLQACIVVEPQYRAAAIDRFFTIPNLAITEIDPMGSEYTTYSDYYRGMVKRVLECLSNR